MKKSVFTLIAVLVLGTTTMNAQRYGGGRHDNGSRVENMQRGRGGREAVRGTTRYGGGGYIATPRREVIVERGYGRPCPPPPPVRVVHHPVRPVHVVHHRPAPVYVEPVCVAPCPPPVVVHNSTAAGIVAGAITVTALAALLAH